LGSGEIIGVDRVIHMKAAIRLKLSAKKYGSAKAVSICNMK
jgi:hypothetical protein